MNAKTILSNMELIAYELAAAETCARQGLRHRAIAMKLLGAMHCEFSDALDAAAEAKAVAQRKTMHAEFAEAAKISARRVAESD
jgi:hypothetical protein